MIAVLLAVVVAASTPKDPVCTRLVREFSNPVFTHVTDSGLRYIVLKPGTAALKIPNVAMIQYVLCGTDGTKIDASSPNASLGVSLGQKEVIRGFEEAVILAGRNGAVDADLPYQLAYGAKGSPPVIKPKMTLLFAIRVVGSAPISLSTILVRALGRGGELAMRRAYAAASANHFAGMYSAEDDMQGEAEHLMRHKNYDWAIALFKLETERFPESGDAYELLGEANRRAGHKAEARAAFMTALRLNPKDKDAAAGLKALGAGKH